MRPFHGWFRAFAVATLLVPTLIAPAEANTIGQQAAWTPRFARPSAACAKLRGSWHNIDPATRSITHIDVSTNCAAGVVKIQVWGACHPHDCKWCPFFGTYDRKRQMIIGRSIASFKVADLTIRADAHEHVVVTTFSHFTDDSDRDDYTVVDRMER